MAPDESSPTLLRIIEASGLAPVIAKGVMARCCARIKVSPSEVRPVDIPALLPHLETLLQLYLKPREASERIAALRALHR